MQTSQPQKTKKLEIKVKKPGDQGKKTWRFGEGYVYGVRLQTKVRVNQDTFCMIMN